MFKWYINSWEIKDDPNIESSNDEFGYAKLLFCDTGARDGGEITCVAINDAGQASTTALLSVEGTPPLY